MSIIVSGPNLSARKPSIGPRKLPSILTTEKAPDINALLHRNSCSKAMKNKPIHCVLSPISKHSRAIPEKATNHGLRS